MLSGRDTSYPRDPTRSWHPISGSIDLWSSPNVPMVYVLQFDPAGAVTATLTWWGHSTSSLAGR